MYLKDVNQEKQEALGRNDRIGLCGNCRYSRQIKSDRASIFHLCERSATDASFPKYPRLPVLQCVGYEPASAKGGQG